MIFNIVDRQLVFPLLLCPDYLEVKKRSKIVICWNITCFLGHYQLQLREQRSILIGHHLGRFMYGQEISYFYGQLDIGINGKCSFRNICTYKSAIILAICTSWFWASFIHGRSAFRLCDYEAETYEKIISTSCASKYVAVR